MSPRMTSFHDTKNTASTPVKTAKLVRRPTLAAAAVATVVDCVDVGAAVTADVLCAPPETLDMMPWTMTVLVPAAGRLATAVDMTKAVVTAGDSEVSTSRVSDAVTRFATGLEELA